MPSRPPRVSIILPTYNRAESVGEAIASALLQEYADLEVVLVDDGSTDGTLDMVRRRFGNDARLRTFRQPNGGCARARNAGLDLATGELIAFLDSDDVYRPGFVAAQVARLSAAPDAAMSVCDIAYEGAWPKPGGTHFGRVPAGLPRSIEDMVLGGWFLMTGLLFRAPVIRSLRFDPEWYAEDSEMLCRFLLAGHTYVVEPRVLGAYRFHAGEVGEPQRVNAGDCVVREAMRLESAYLPRCRFSRQMRSKFHRRWGRRLTRAGLHTEARPHLWAWWRSRPLQLSAAWHLLRGTLRRRTEPAACPRPEGRPAP